MVAIGTSIEGRTIYMIVGTTASNFDPQTLKILGNQRYWSKLVFTLAKLMARMHDAFTRYCFGGKTDLLDNVNFYLFHFKRRCARKCFSHNRPNQRGPENIGWRTNAQNLNLNRDYAKLDTREIRAVVNIMNLYSPDLYMDIHVTDGADYQYDITFGIGLQGNRYC
jgi:murein tripeptide amidase MpaA